MTSTHANRGDATQPRRPWYKRPAPVVAGVVFGLWLLTLGVFHESYIRTLSFTDNASGWSKFEAGNRRVSPSAWLTTEHVSRWGAPFVLASRSDRGPFELSLSFTIHADDPALSVVIESIEIGYTDGTTQPIGIPETGLAADFGLDERGADLGEKAYQRAFITVHGSVIDEQDCIIKLNGRLVSNSTEDRYEDTIELDIGRETYLYIGWIALMLQAL
ncbi:MAG: hypothetical protein AAGC44_08045 [Planctomycetota bacterium]